MRESDWRDRLEKLRSEIDELDRQLVGLLNRRTTIVREIGLIKLKLGLPVCEPQREMAVFENIARHNGGPLSSRALQRVFEVILEEMRQIQESQREEKAIERD